MAIFQLEPGSFRDRTSRVYYSSTSVFRALDKQALGEWEVLSSKKFFHSFLAQGKIIQTEQCGPPENLDSAMSGTWVAFLRHKTIPFISYPYEWSFGMLKDAALLQLDLLLAALDEDMILKDSSAFNFQWIGSSPVFIDIPSFIRLTPGEPWIGYKQFCQMYLYPLMLQVYRGIPFQQLFRGSIDGFEPEHFSRLMSFRDMFRPGVFPHVYLQAKAQMKFADTEKDIRKSLQTVGFSKELIKNNVLNLCKLIYRLLWKPSRSQWSHYAGEHSYTDTEHEIKKSFVRDVVSSRPWKLVWDIGCNTGIFSRIAAQNSEYVVAMDADHLAIEYLYQDLKKERNNKILPLIGNIADPSPNMGWRGLERKTLQERGKPDLTLCLALIHHIVITANIPLKEFIDWLASLGTSLVIEFVTKEDPMVKKLLKNKEDNYTDYEVGYFENCLAESFHLLKTERMKSGNRILYFAESRTR
jgi:SAM-dependent methyltransferase